MWAYFVRRIRDWSVELDEETLPGQTYRTTTFKPDYRNLWNNYKKKKLAVIGSAVRRTIHEIEALLNASPAKLDEPEERFAILQSKDTS